MKKAIFRKLILVCAAVLFFHCSKGQDTAFAAKDTSLMVQSDTADHALYGKASYYADKFHGRKTASGEVFDQKKLTAACNVLPLGTWVQVTNLSNGKMVVLKTNDRLSPKNKRLVDVSKLAAQKLGFIAAGLTKVKVIVLDQSLYPE